MFRTSIKNELTNEEREDLIKKYSFFKSSHKKTPVFLSGLYFVAVFMLFLLPAFMASPDDVMASDTIYFHHLN